jgi:hypothetical protein
MRAVTALRAFRAYGHPLLLIGAWGVLELLAVAWTEILPGEPASGSASDPIVWTTFFVVAMALRFRVGWWLAITAVVINLSVALAFAVVSFRVKPLGLAVFHAAALWLIWAGNVELYELCAQRLRRLALPPPE